MTKYVEAPHDIQVEPFDRVVFLAGPIQGAPPWQEEAARLLADADLVVANPRRKAFAMSDPTAYDVQVAWETRWLHRARYVMFWLAAEAEAVPGRSYGQTTRFELGEWLLRPGTPSDKVIVGADPGFPGTKYLQTRYQQHYGRPLTIWPTLEQTCQEVYRRNFAWLQSL